MDPGTAVVAFTGFAASVITIVGLVTESCKTLYNLQAKVKHASEDFQRLSEKLRTLERLLAELQKSVVGEDDVSTETQTVWKETVAQMEADMSRFNSLLRQLEKKMGTESLSGLNVRMRVKWVFMDDPVADYNNRLAWHIQSLQMIQGSIIG